MSRHTVLANDFYISGTFWLTAGLLVLTLLLTGFAYWTIVVARNRRTLSWEQSIVSMLRNDRRLAGSLAVTWEGQQVTNPTLATVQLRNASRVDIGTSAFDGGRPIVIHFETNILALLEPDATLKNGLVPVQLARNTVRIGPGLLKKGTEIRIVALTEAYGKCSLETPLENVHVAEKSTSDPSLLDRYSALLSAGAAVVAAISVAIASFTRT